MTANTTNGRIRSALGEHLIALLVIAVVVLGALATYPALAAETKGTASKVQERVNTPLAVAAYLDDQATTLNSP